MSNNKKLRKKFDNIKRRKGYYKQFNGKKKDYELHHPEGLSALEYVVYLFSFVHVFTHKMKNILDIDEPEWHNKKPTIQEQWDAVEISLTKKAVRDVNQRAVIEEMQGR